MQSLHHRRLSYSEIQNKAATENFKTLRNFDCYVDYFGSKSYIIYLTSFWLATLATVTHEVMSLCQQLVPQDLVRQRFI